MANGAAQAIDAKRMEDEPSYDITVTDECDAATPDADRLIDVIKAVLHRHEATRARINVAMVDDRAIAALNETHLQHAGPTDVLTFDLRDDPIDGDNGRRQVDGQIVLSVQTAVREAAARGHDVTAELALYVVHGLLHLLGHDDAADSDARRMHQLEDEILFSFGFGYVYDKERS